MIEANQQDRRTTLTETEKVEIPIKILNQFKIQMGNSGLNMTQYDTNAKVVKYVETHRKQIDFGKIDESIGK
jgi:hypothetical protein